MSLSLSTQQLTQLQAVFGSRVPKDAQGAAEMLAQSPAAPSSPAELAALRQALLEVAGAELSDVKAAADAVAQSRPVGMGQRPTPGPLAARLQQMTGAERVASAPGLDKVITPERAQALFDQVANDPRIPHKFVDDGCHFRSTLVAKAFDDAGVFSEKIVSNADRSDLKLLTDTNSAGFTLCMFHMATAVWVDGGNGPERKVIDPSFGTGPMSIAQWHTHMHGLNHKPLQTYFLPRFCGHPMDRDNPPAAWQQKDLDEATAWNTEYKGFQDMLVAQDFYAQLPKMEAEMVEIHRRDALPEAWAQVGEDYRPVEVETPAHVRSAMGDWADPEQVAPETLMARTTFANGGNIALDDSGRPLNPSGPTGKRGRLLGKWGPNHAADPVILRRDPETGRLQMLAIERKDTGRWAIPGGMVDAGERMSATATRELKEETNVDVDMSDAVKVYEGVVKDDPRNTDNAWMETAVYAKLLDDDTGARAQPTAGDDARQVRWMTLTDDTIGQLYANHGEFVLKALEVLGERPANQA